MRQLGRLIEVRGLKHMCQGLSSYLQAWNPVRVTAAVPHAVAQAAAALHTVLPVKHSSPQECVQRMSSPLADLSPDQSYDHSACSIAFLAKQLIGTTVMYFL